MVLISDHCNKVSHIKFLVVLAEMKYHCISPSELLGVLFISSNIFKEFFFSWVASLNSRINIFNKPYYKPMHCHRGYVVLGIEHSKGIQQFVVCNILSHLNHSAAIQYKNYWAHCTNKKTEYWEEKEIFTNFVLGIPTRLITCLNELISPYGNQLLNVAGMFLKY